MFKLLLKLRAVLVRSMWPAKKYLKLKKLNPLSQKFGFDRGAPIDRYWIEDFLNKNKHYIKGTVLEITDSAYTKKYGQNKVRKSDVLDIDRNNNKANIVGDLRDLKNVVQDNSYDCIILTHVLGLIDDYTSAIKEIYRILKPNGVLLYTGSCLGPILGEKVYWRFTRDSVNYIFSKSFKPGNILIKTYGNVLSGKYFWVGMAQEELSSNELNYNDSRYACIVTAVIKK